MHISKATPPDHSYIAHIGRIAVEEAHRNSCSAADMQTFLNETYNDKAVEQDLLDPANCYHILSHENKPVGFSKIIFNASHPNINITNVAKLDRIYLLSEYFGLGFGAALLKLNIEIAKSNDQAGLWLFTWTGNTRAVDFYRKAGFTIIGGHRFKVTETHYNEHHQMLLSF